MLYTEEGIVLAIKNFGEKGRVITIFTKRRGKIKGFIKSSVVLSKGDICYVTWHGRLPDQLGTLKIEVSQSIFRYIFNSPYSNCAVQSICDLLLNATYDEDAHIELYAETEKCLQNISNKSAYAIWEIAFLKYIGYGLDISECCVTHAKNNLFYISPKTGKAVTKDIGTPYRDRLFVIPTFWINNSIATTADISASLKITGYFLEKSIFHDCSISKIYRNMLVKWLITDALSEKNSANCASAK